MKCQKRTHAGRFSNLPAFRLPSSVLPISVLVVFWGLLLVVPAANAQTAPDTQSQVQLLIQQLGQTDFDQRESAEQQLIEMGAPAADFLIKELINDCKPDLCSRIKRILHGCLERCEKEEDFFKVLAVLRIRYEISEQQIRSLLVRWTFQQRADIVAQWRRLGAVVFDPLEGGANANLLGNLEGRFLNELAQARGNLIQIEILRSKQKASTGRAQSKVNRSEPENRTTAERLKLVLTGSVEQNKKLVTNFKSGADGFIKSLATMRQEPVTVTIGADWRGGDSVFDFAKSKAVLPIGSFELQKKVVDDSLLLVLKDHPVRAVTLSECSIAADIKEALPTTVSALSIMGPANLPETLKVISGSNLSLDRIRLVETKFGKQEALALKDLQKLTSLELTKINIGKDGFEGLLPILQLNRLTLDRCKFPTAEFIEYRAKKKGEVVVNFTAKAFLGVSSNQFRGLRRGNLAPPQQPEDDCIVTEVVPGEAAERAGMKPGDEILRIGGQKLETFDDLRIVIAQFDVGEEVTIQILRDGKEQTLTATLGAHADKR